MPVRTIADLPFRRRPSLELLHLDAARDAPDPDYAGFGYTRVGHVTLESKEGTARVVRDALLVAVHSADGSEGLPDDLELEFFLDEAGDDSVTVLLSDFLRVWLPRIRGDEAAIVLVACNPHRARIAPPETAGGVPVHYAVGDVETWLDARDDRPTLCLAAEGWCTAE